MRRERRNSQLDAIRTIDLTNLIDVAFTLLIVFMITIPLVEYNMNVNPPEMNAEPMESKEDSIYVNVDGKNQIFFQDRRVSEKMLGEKVSEAIGRKSDTTIFLRADGTCSYNEVMQVMKVIKTAGAKNISLITLKEE